MTVQPISKALARQQTETFEPSEVITSAVLLERLSVLFDELDAAHEAVEKAAQAAVEAEYTYELAFTSSRVSLEGGEGTAGYKEAKAMQSAAEKKREWGFAKEALRAAKKAEDLVSTKVSALQTVAANAREEMRLAGRLDPQERTS